MLIIIIGMGIGIITSITEIAVQLYLEMVKIVKSPNLTYKASRQVSQSLLAQTHQ